MLWAEIDFQAPRALVLQHEAPVGVRYRIWIQQGLLCRAIAIALARAGAEVAVNFVSREAEARKVCSEIKTIGRRTLAVKADVSVSKEVAKMVSQVEKEMGPVSVLVNNVGISRPQSLDQITEHDWDEILTVNLKSMFLVTQAVLPGMRKQRWGRIINLSSVAAQLGEVIGPHYAAFKAAKRKPKTRMRCLHMTTFLPWNGAFEKF